MKIFLDTDIGDDIDDATALALILSSPSLLLQGISTVAGHTKARAESALSFLHAAGGPFRSIPVACGCAGNLTGFKQHSFQHAYQDISKGVLPGYAAASFASSELPPMDSRTGAQLIIDTYMASDHDISLIAIGPMTNIAVALITEPSLWTRVPHIYAMLGEITRPFPEHNAQADAIAADIVLKSGIPMTIIPCHIGGMAEFQPHDLIRLRNINTPVAKQLVSCLDQFIKGWGKTIVPFDPLTVAALSQPDLFEWKHGQMSIEAAQAVAHGVTPFTENVSDASLALHKVAVSVDREKSVDFILNIIESFR